MSQNDPTNTVLDHTNADKVKVSRAAFLELERRAKRACEALSNEGRDAIAGDLEDALEQAKASMTRA